MSSAASARRIRRTESTGSPVSAASSRTVVATVGDQVGDPGPRDRADRLRDHEAVGVGEQRGARVASRQRARASRTCRAPRTPRRPPVHARAGTSCVTGTVTRPSAKQRQHRLAQPLDHERLLVGAARTQRRAVDPGALVHDEPEVDLGSRDRRRCRSRAADRAARAASTSSVRFGPPTSSRITSYSPCGSVAAPSACTWSALCRAVPVTSAPSATPSCTAAVPTPPAAPLTSRRSPGQQQRLGEERVVRGRVRLHEAARLRPVDARRAPAARAARRPTTSSAWPPPPSRSAITRSPRADDLARALEARDVGGRAGRRRVVTGDAASGRRC